MRSGISWMGGMTSVLGFTLFGLEHTSSGGLMGLVAWAVSVGSLAVLAGYVWAVSDKANFDVAIATAQYFYVLWVIWSIILGVGLLKSSGEASSS